MICADCALNKPDGVFFKPWVCSQHVGAVKRQFRCLECETLKIERDSKPQETIDLSSIIRWHCNAIRYDFEPLPNHRLKLNSKTNCRDRNEKVLCRGCTNEIKAGR